MSKKKHAEEHENLERWLVSYADFITLLFAFFTVLYALSVSDKAKYRETLENIQRSFLQAGGMFPLKGSPFVPFDRPSPQSAEIPPNPGDIGKMPRSTQETARITDQIHSLFKETTGLALKPGQVEVVRTQDGYRIRLGEDVLFGPGSDKIKRTSVPFLYEVGKRLERLGLPIQVEGHSDASPSVSPKTNWQLSISRAYNVVQFLVMGAGFPETRISLTGYGDTQPLAGNDTPQGRAKNRRVEIAIISPNQDSQELNW